MNGISNIGFGCVSLTQHTFQHKAIDLLSAAFGEGITHFDTAPVYGNGYSEKILGKFIKTRREEVTITTKCGLGNLQQPSVPVQFALPLQSLKRMLKKQPAGPQDERHSEPIPLAPRSISVEYVQRSLANSLNNLQTGYIDYYLLHEALPVFLSKEAYSFLLEQRQKGVIRRLGIAAAYVNLLPLEKEELSAWELLQYEYGIHYPTDHLVKRFNDKTHFYHSTLKFLTSLPRNLHSSEEWAGILLNRSVKNNPEGKVLFATTRADRVCKNLRAYKLYNDRPLEELNTMVNAVH